MRIEYKRTTIEVITRECSWEETREYGSGIAKEPMFEREVLEINVGNKELARDEPLFDVAANYVMRHPDLGETIDDN